MSGAVCPSCGVAVVPGYVRCPKCRKPLPKLASNIKGGTAIEAPTRSAPAIIGAIAAIVVGGGIIAFFALRKSDHKTVQAGPAAPAAQPTAPEADTPAPTPDQPSATQTAPAAPQPEDVAADLERRLKKQRLWSTVSIIGGRAEVRSESCSDAAMVPMLDGAAPAFKAAGLTKLRCVEQSGRVVSDRDL